MNDSTGEISPLRQRMVEDMRLRKLAPHTQDAYVRSVRRLAGYLRRTPDTATVEDLRNFQLHLVDQGTSPITLNATITGLKFLSDTRHYRRLGEIQDGSMSDDDPIAVMVVTEPKANSTWGQRPPNSYEAIGTLNTWSTKPCRPQASAAAPATTINGIK